MATTQTKSAQPAPTSNGSSNHNVGFWQRIRHRTVMKKSPVNDTNHSRGPSKPAQADVPEAWQCITHLKLLRKFASVRQNVVEDLLEPSVHRELSEQVRSIMSSSTTAATEPASNDTGATQHPRDQVFRDVYLQQALCRFEKWWRALAASSSSTQRRGAEAGGEVTCSIYDESGRLEAMLREAKPMVWTTANLPPIDVIMILHSFMLNPRCFLEDCVRFGMLGLWKAGMPWRTLDDALDDPPDDYVVSTAAQKAWTKLTGCEWELSKECLRSVYACPTCGRDATLKQKKEDEKAFVRCDGACQVEFDDEQLHVHKFASSVEKLRRCDVPLPGTLLSVDGLLNSADSNDSKKKEQRENDSVIVEPFGLNTLLLGDVGQQILDLARTSTTTKPENNNKPTTLQTLQTLIEQTPEYTEYKPIRLALRRTLLQSRDSLSIFSLDLVSAVVRQYSFTTQMMLACWLHSPALSHTMHALLSRYRIFFQIMSTYPNHVAVPTFAVDLAWHTHQTLCESYYEYSVRETKGVFIDHDDRIGEGVRDDAFGWTTSQYRALSGGKEYGECLCWFCAAVHEEDTEGEYKHKHAPDGGHVMVPAKSKPETRALERVAAAQYRKLEEDYLVAEQRARDRHTKWPGKEEFLRGYTWLYPGAVPVLN